ncbi:MAG: ATP-dependent protease ATPase subunit HslU [Myxococcales bacterium]|nr:ATP-dependent protease ATPase subunit HslU [Myxococcales bacterium]MDH3484943.1 ATP-dependent protease ATPase subunit HslU [Myxococcales bacterium]
MTLGNFTPRETVGELDRYIIGQDKAKRAVAIALRNRWRRQQVTDELRDEIAPRNIIMIGPTGVGKTEIARRLAKLARAPFVKVEASKFTEVGYVGRDVESMIRDLVENAIQICEWEALEGVQTRAQDSAEERLARMILLAQRPQAQPQQSEVKPQTHQFGPLSFQITPQQGPQAQAFFSDSEVNDTRQRIRNGELDDVEVELDVTDTNNPFMTIFGAQGTEEVNLQDMMSQMPGFKGRTKRRRLKVPEALEVLKQEEAGKLIDRDAVQRDAVQRTEQAGIVFLDEIDKVSSDRRVGGPDVSREGVQRDLLPIVEGSTVSTKYGVVKTDHILFIAAGAFHVSKVADLIPELQGRFPIRVELDSLEKGDFVRILVEPKNALTKQYQALMATEGIELVFEPNAIEELAGYAAEANRRAENIGARRLYTIMEALLEELSYHASERADSKFVVDVEYVRTTLEPILADEDLAKYIL